MASILEHFLLCIYLSLIGENYQPGPPPAYYPEEFYDDRAYKRRGFAVSSDSFHCNK